MKAFCARLSILLMLAAFGLGSGFATQAVLAPNAALARDTCEWNECRDNEEWQEKYCDFSTQPYNCDVGQQQGSSRPCGMWGCAGHW